MGTAGQSRQGLFIRTRPVGTYTPSGPHTGKLVKYSEVRLLLLDFAHEADAPIDFTQAVHDVGLKIGMSFRRLQAANADVAWAADVPNHNFPQTLSYTPLAPNAGIKAKLDAQFNTDGTWKAFFIDKNLVMPPGPKSIYIQTTLNPFATLNDRDVHFVPVVVVLGNFDDFTQHYALGISTYTKGLAAGGFEFDSQILSN